MLASRAALLAQIRQFFATRKVLEVDPPVLATASVTDINIDSVAATVRGQNSYLQTSPEYFMKRMLAAGSGDIYSLGRAFRDAELGPRHNPEFTLLEWYRSGWDEFQLMAEVEVLISELYHSQHQAELPVSKLSYADCFAEVFAIEPHRCELSQLQQLAAESGSQSWCNESRANCLDLLFSTGVEPQLPEGLVFVYHYPACQAALAQIESSAEGYPVSRRFEVFLQGMELANGYLELTDADQQRQRFEADNAVRTAAQRAPMPIDKNLDLAMRAGLPPCAGVALGVDRLLMQLQGVNSIDRVLPFAWQHC